MSRIKQAVAKVVKTDKSYYWIRISRQSFSNIEKYWRKQPDFYYLKIYAIDNYSRNTTKNGLKHKIGRQLGFVTQNGSRFFG